MNEVRVSRLHWGRTSKVRLPAGARLLVARGECWLTASGDPKDYILRPGDEFQARGEKELEVLIQALERTVVYAVRYPSRVAEAPDGAVCNTVPQATSPSARCRHWQHEQSTYHTRTPPWNTRIVPKTAG